MQHTLKLFYNNFIISFLEDHKKILLLLYLRAFLQISVLLMNFSIAAKDDYDLLLPSWLLIFFLLFLIFFQFFSGLYWWSQSGSNRRPSACKADALPAELWPLNT
jgi:hypothetical protein